MPYCLIRLGCQQEADTQMQICNGGFFFLVCFLLLGFQLLCLLLLGLLSQVIPLPVTPLPLILFLPFILFLTTLLFFFLVCFPQPNAPILGVSQLAAPQLSPPPTSPFLKSAGREDTSPLGTHQHRRSVAPLHGGSLLRCARIKLVNNGYRDIIIAINPGVFDENLIESIKEMVREASIYLHQATKQQFYFSEVKILLPFTWTINSNLVQRLRTQTYAKADVIIAEPSLKHGDTPYTRQYGGCGEKGRYIHFTPNFILNDSLASAHGTRGQMFVHEWAHLQWGVFDEHNDLVPFYINSDGVVEATRCSKKMKGKTADCTGTSCTPCKIDANTGLPNGNCKFFPEKDQSSSSSIMYVQGLPNVVEFCDNETHNVEAPNMQNRVCNHRSTWDVISKSDDFRNVSSPHTGSVKPTFTLLQAKHRVVCLVLDVSGSMGVENRINKLRQAAKIFLLQIIEEGSHVGIVTFHSTASTASQLKLIDGENARNELAQLLPTSARGDINVCAGILSGFEVLRGDDGATNGDEIILLVLGKDSGMRSCFAEVEQSGAIIHTIAIGPNVTEELEQLSVTTGGLQFAVAGNLETSEFIDALSGLSSANGDINQHSVQLESLGSRIGNDKWLNGTVLLDKSVGNNTFFTVTWEAQTPNVFVRDPSGKMYNNRDFVIDRMEHTAHLKIQGTAQTGTWIYCILNPGIQQVVTITVTSKAADAKDPPITVNAHISRKGSASPVIIYMEVTRGFLPVLDAKVTAIIECPSGPPIEQELHDDGLGADVNRNDGVYSKYFLNFNGAGRCSVQVRVQGKEGSTRVEGKRRRHALSRAKYRENGGIQNLPEKLLFKEEDLVVQLGGFSRVKSGGVILFPSETHSDHFPPCKITDLQATASENKVELEWTAPGGDYDQGKASRYEVRMSENLPQLLDHFSSATLVDVVSLKPQPFGSREAVTIALENTGLRKGRTLYFAVHTHDENHLISEISNIAKASGFGLPIEHSIDINISVIVSVVAIVVFIICFITLITNCVLNHVHRKRIFADEDSWTERK
ncbi:calcium-activated chloride channel regulator 1-like [Narcine bancroftii]|uniref:calcium-activated chloride channel regulator 1-like n=1 Tax=Narcine bancroftii TaxID=1343680 RepID=UPI0038314FE0